jgi:predicted dehydrogenase
MKPAANPALNRRQFLHATATATAGVGLASLASLGSSRGAAASPNGKLRVLSIGVVGAIGIADRLNVASHPAVEISGLCDVDANALAQAATDHPHAFTCRDYRDAFATHAGKFDAVIVAVPDHSHAPILLTALAHDKHVYGQKPLVHQLAELVMVEQALQAKPHLVTQLGNQRMAKPGRRAAVEILRHGQLGKAIEAYCWFNSPNVNEYFNHQKILRPNPVVPPHLAWDLWLGPCAAMPYHELLVPLRWRSWWDFGGNGLGDWGCHVLDVILLAYDELSSPVAVSTTCAEPAGKYFHVNPCKSTVIYQVNSARFAGQTFPIHLYDSNQRPSPQQLRLPEAIADNTMTVVVCEHGTLTLEVEGRLRIWRDGKMEEGLQLPGLPEFEPLNHWHAWVDNCIGKKTALLTPFKDAVRITEPVLLAVKASRFPGQQLLWDKAKLAFTNHPLATQTLVHRDYRDGFGPPRPAPSAGLTPPG